MNKKLITEYLLKEERRDVSKIIERDLKIKLIEGKVVSIIGPRRAGKTYFLYKLREKFKNSLHLNFEDSSLKNLQVNEIYDVLALYQEIFGRKPRTLFFDEIQNLKDWQTLIRSLLDREEFNIFITGSSSKLLSREIATQLRGRSISYVLLPFSFGEFLKIEKIKPTKYLLMEEEAKIKRALRNFMGYGSFPEVILKRDKERILREYYNTILYTDFIERFGLKNMELAKSLFEFFFQNFSKEFSVRKFLNFLRAGKNTIYEYVEKLPETFAVFFVEKFSKSIYLRKSWPKKAYVCDLGLSKILGFSEDTGKKMENTVFLELFRLVNINPLTTVYFYKSKEGYEVDFVIKEGARIKHLIQVTYASARDEIDRREIKALLKAGRELKCKNLLVITWDYEDEEKINNKKIKFVPLWKWLLGV